jgi:hypothetical protein
MGKEYLTDLKAKKEADLRVMLKEAESDRNYQLQLDIYRLLLPFEERPCLALTAIKELEELINRTVNPEENAI